MKEVCELRVVEEFANRLFAADEGELLSSGSVRKIELPTSDPRFQRVGELQALLNQTLNRSFFHGWQLKRYYTSAELNAAVLFQLIATSFFEPAGEECGTEYDETTSCPECKSGAKQISALILPVKRIPKSKDVSETITRQVVVSRRLKEIFFEHAIRGADFIPLRHSRASSAESKDWFQLVIRSADADIVPPTKAGVGPFDEDKAGRYRCPRGDLIGLNLLSEATVSFPSTDMPDIFCSRQFIGSRRGLLRPHRLVFVSPKLQQIMSEMKVRGAKFEVAYVANRPEQAHKENRHSDK